MGRGRRSAACRIRARVPPSARTCGHARRMEAPARTEACRGAGRVPGAEGWKGLNFAGWGSPHSSVCMMDMSRPMTSRVIHVGRFINALMYVTSAPISIGFIKHAVTLCTIDMPYCDTTPHDCHAIIILVGSGGPPVQDDKCRAYSTSTICLSCRTSSARQADMVHSVQSSPEPPGCCRIQVGGLLTFGVDDCKWLPKLVSVLLELPSDAAACRPCHTSASTADHFRQPSLYNSNILWAHVHTVSIDARVRTHTYSHLTSDVARGHAQLTGTI